MRDAEVESVTTKLFELLEDETLGAKIKRKLPVLFYLAEQQASRAGRVGMEVGTLREQILIALLIYKFGEENVQVDVPITEAEVDVVLFGRPLSIKTVTAKSEHVPAVKVIWTVDWAKVEEFVNRYSPRCDLLLAVVRWEAEGGLYIVPLEVQEQVFRELGREHYLRVPQRGTNPRGVELSRQAVRKLLDHPQTRKLVIHWARPSETTKHELQLAPYKRWLRFWEED